MACWRSPAAQRTPLGRQSHELTISAARSVCAELPFPFPLSPFQRQRQRLSLPSVWMDEDEDFPQWLKSRRQRFTFHGSRRTENRDTVRRRALELGAHRRTPSLALASPSPSPCPTATSVLLRGRCRCWAVPRRDLTLRSPTAREQGSRLVGRASTVGCSLPRIWFLVTFPPPPPTSILYYRRRHTPKGAQQGNACTCSTFHKAIATGEMSRHLLSSGSTGPGP